MRTIGIDEAINRIAERTAENRQELRKTRMQRRTEFTDLYGVPFYAESDSENNARFYISVSPGLVYFMRFQFKLYIQDAADDAEFKLYMSGIDLTEYLTEQEDGEWIDGNGLYPTKDAEDALDYYDILDVATLKYNSDEEGDHDDADKILSPGFKTMRIESDSPFKATMYLYMKYSTRDL